MFRRTKHCFFESDLQDNSQRYESRKILSENDQTVKGFEGFFKEWAEQTL
ncbi:MAG TPA: hypothetical protein PKA79_03775 [Oligoflexia bacterium]|nr:hypothetical protein [Oligoflexia bacterium]